jgi:hypothetical protein
MHHAPLFLSSVLLVALAAPDALAQPASNGSAADALFQSAKAAMVRGDFATACSQLTESLHLDPEPGTMLNLAECEDRRGQVASALAHLEEARRRLPPNDYRVAFTEQRIVALGKRTPRLSLRLADGVKAEGLRVQRDGVEVAPGSFGTALLLDPGVHVFVVSLAGREDARVEVTLHEGDARVVELAPGPVSSGHAAAAVTALPPATVPVRGDGPSAPQRGGTQRTVGLVVGAAGVVGLGLGGVFGLLSKSTYDGATKHCPAGPTSCDGTGIKGGTTAYGQATVSTVTFICGGALLLAGVALYLTAPPAGATAVMPMAGPSFGGLSLQGGF